MLEISILAHSSSSLNPCWSGTFALCTFPFIHDQPLGVHKQVAAH